MPLLLLQSLPQPLLRLLATSFSNHGLIAKSRSGPMRTASRFHRDPSAMSFSPLLASTVLSLLATTSPTLQRVLHPSPATLPQVPLLLPVSLLQVPHLSLASLARALHLMPAITLPLHTAPLLQMLQSTLPRLLITLPSRPTRLSTLR